VTVLRLSALALAVTALPATAASNPPAKIAYRNGPSVLVGGQVIARNVPGAVRWSGDGKLLSIGGRVVGGPQLAAADLAWAPTGERTAFTTKRGGVGIWTPAQGTRAIVPDGWGATSLAWSSDGALAIGRAVCRGACGRPSHTEVWVRRDGALHRVVGPLADDAQPIVVGWSGGEVLWWRYPDSASTAADGIGLYADERRVSFGLMYPDYVAVCGRHFAVAVGSDRYAMHGKRIVFDGRDVSGDLSRSWVSPSCTADGRLVAAASANTVPSRIGNEHRAIWQLLPMRRQLTHPPKGRSDEDPHLLADGVVVFVRTRSVSKPRDLYGVGTIEVLRDGRLTAIGSTAKADNYYGHYSWSDLVAVHP
jgi:hypothetical protein